MRDANRRDHPRRCSAFRRRRVLALLGALLAICFWTGGAHAGGRRGAGLRWARGDAAEGCVGVLGLAEDVKRRLGWDPFVLPVEIAIEGVAVRVKGGFRAELTFRDRDGKPIGTRRFESPGDCRALGETVAVAIAVAIEPDATEPPAAVVLEPPPAPAPVPPREERAVPPGRRRARLAAAAGALPGLVPGLGGAVGIAGGVVVAERVEVSLGGIYAPPSEEGAFDFGMAVVRARACALPWGAEGLVRLCGAVLGGAFESYSRAEDLVPLDVGASAWVGVEAGAVVSLALQGPLRFELGAGAVVPLTRRSGVVRGAAEPIWEQSIVAASVDAGLALLF